jgi:hypothetical protein
MDGDACVPIKLYLQGPVDDYTWTTPDLFHTTAVRIKWGHVCKMLTTGSTQESYSLEEWGLGEKREWRSHSDPRSRRTGLSFVNTMLKGSSFHFFFLPGNQSTKRRDLDILSKGRNGTLVFCSPHLIVFEDEHFLRCVYRHMSAIARRVFENSPALFDILYVLPPPIYSLY